MDRILSIVVADDRPINCPRHHEPATHWIDFNAVRVSGGPIPVCGRCIDDLYHEMRVFFGDV
jgi:hypothetical protein